MSEARVVEFPPELTAASRLKKRLWWIAAVLAVVIVVGGIVALAQFSGWLGIKEIKVQGTELAASQTISEKLQPLMGKPLSQVDRAQVQELLQGEQAVDEVRIAAEPPSTLVVSVKERRPVAILDLDGKLTLIDREGVLLKGVDSQEAGKLPVIDGGRSALQSNVFTTITSVLEALPDDVLSQLVKASAESTTSVQLKLADGKTILWGSATENALKSAVVQSLLKQAPQDPPVTVIDVSAPSSPVTR